MTEWAKRSGRLREVKVILEEEPFVIASIVPCDCYYANSRDASSWLLSHMNEPIEVLGENLWEGMYKNDSRPLPSHVKTCFKIFDGGGEIDQWYQFPLEAVTFVVVQPSATTLSDDEVQLQILDVELNVRQYLKQQTQRKMADMIDKSDRLKTWSLHEYSRT